METGKVAAVVTEDVAHFPGFSPAGQFRKRRRSGGDQFKPGWGACRLSGKQAGFGLEVNHQGLRVERGSDLPLEHSRKTPPVLGSADLLAQLLQDDASVVRIAEKGAIDFPGSAPGDFTTAPREEPSESYARA
jgi:hypothetical protein